MLLSSYQQILCFSVISLLQAVPVDVIHLPAVDVPALVPDWELKQKKKKKEVEKIIFNLLCLKIKSCLETAPSRRRDGWAPVPAVSSPFTDNLRHTALCTKGYWWPMKFEPVSMIHLISHLLLQSNEFQVDVMHKGQVWQLANRNKAMMFRWPVTCGHTSAAQRSEETTCQKFLQDILSNILCTRAI